MFQWLEDEENDALQGNFYEEGQVPSRLPDSLERGFEMIYGEYIPQWEVEAFASRWGGLDEQAFQRALAQGQGEDRLLAICALGSTDSPQAPTLLLPFLQSSDPRERWASAICLGQMKQEISFPVLVNMLTEFLPSQEAPYSKEQEDERPWFDNWRIRVARVLNQWQHSSLIAVFRHALESSLQAESHTPFDKQFWFIYQDVLIGALGQRGAFGALTGLPLSSHRLRHAVITMVASYCHAKDYEDEEEAHEHVRLPRPWARHQSLKEAMAKVLEQQFGLSQEEQIFYLENYTRDASMRRQQLELLHSEDYLKLKQRLIALVEHALSLPEEKRQDYLNRYAHDLEKDLPD